MIDPILVQIADALRVLARERIRAHPTTCTTCRWFIARRQICTAYTRAEYLGIEVPKYMMETGCPKHERQST